jgi:hypothetical protein
VTRSPDPGDWALARPGLTPPPGLRFQRLRLRADLNPERPNLLKPEEPFRVYAWSS